MAVGDIVVVGLLVIVADCVDWEEYVDVDVRVFVVDGVGVSVGVCVGVDEPVPVEEGV